MLLLIRYTNTSNQPAPSPQVSIQEVKTYSATQPMSTNILPDEGYDAMSRVFLSYNIPSQSKEISITSNGTTTVYPDQGYYSLNNVQITTNVQSSQTGNARLKYISLINDMSNPLGVIDIESSIWTVGTSTNPTVAAGKTLVRLKYVSGFLEIYCYCVRASGTAATVNVEGGYYIILNYEIGNSSTVFLFGKDGNLNDIEILECSGLVGYTTSVVRMYINYLAIDYPLSGELIVN